MIRKRILPLLLLALAVGLPQCRKAPSANPDLYLIVIDAAAADYLGCYGDPNGTSPNIDRLAADSVVFDIAYSQSSTTGASTASLITGTRLTTHKKAKNVLPLWFHTLAELLGAQGYTTAAVIANPNAARAGLVRGYQEFVAVYALPQLRKKRPKNEKHKCLIPQPMDVNQQFTQLLPKLKTGPSFVYLHYLQPHTPYDPPAKFMELFYSMDDLTPWEELEKQMIEADKTGLAHEKLIEESRARYRANIRYVDDAVGKLIQHLKKEGLYDNALIIFTSDHGDAFFDHKRFGHNTTLFDDMVRVPFLVKLPADYGVDPKRIDPLIETIDIVPTLLDATGNLIPKQVEGKSFLPRILAEPVDPEDEIVVSTRNLEQHAIRMGRFKYIMNRDGEEQLFDLHDDPMERKNLIGEQPKVAALLRQRMESLVDVHATVDEPDGNGVELDQNTLELLKALGYTDGQ